MSKKEYSIEELETMLKEKKKVPKKKRKKMKTGKKAFWLGMFFSIALIIFSGVMIFVDKDTTTVAIFGGAGVACIPILFSIYEKRSNEISLKHMEKNYIEDYDDKEGIY